MGSMLFFTKMKIINKAILNSEPLKSVWIGLMTSILTQEVNSPLSMDRFLRIQAVASSIVAQDDLVSGDMVDW